MPGKSHKRRSLVGLSPEGREESDMTERLHFHFSLLCTGEGNGNPLHCSCLENPRGGGAWWAAVYGVAQGRTQLKQLSSSSSILTFLIIVNLIYISLMISNVEHLFMYHFIIWPFVCLLWKNFYSILFPIFKLGCFFFFGIDLYEFLIYFGF